MSYGQPQACANPRPEVSYVESAAAMGLPAREEQPHIDGGFVVVDDFDGDGRPDTLLLETLSPVVLAWNKGTHFDAQPIEELVGAWQGNFADIDGDGWRDIALSGIESKLAYGGDGGRFRVEGGVLVPDDSVLPADWTAGQGIDATWLDHGADHDPDLYVVNDMGPRYGGNRLATREDDAFEDGTADCGCGLVMSGMGVSVGDGNGDGLPDLYVANSFLTVLLEALPDGGYVDTTAARRVQPITQAWGMARGAVWLDHDNDGLEDLLVAQGDL